MLETFRRNAETPEETFNRTPVQSIRNSGAFAQLLFVVFQLGKFVKQRNIPLHMDGARVFNAAVGLGIPIARIAKHCDSVLFCLSKGLGAPIGSVLTGDKSFIEK